MSSTTESDIRTRRRPGVMAHYRRILRRRIVLMLLLLLLIVASLLLDFVLGPSGMSLHTLWQTLTDPAAQRPERGSLSGIFVCPTR
jgi:iron complex transport system permease protein